LKKLKNNKSSFNLILDFGILTISLINNKFNLLNLITNILN